MSHHPEFPSCSYYIDISRQWSGAVGDFDTGDGGILPVGIGGEHKRHCQFLAVYDSIQLHGSIRCQVTAL